MFEPVRGGTRGGQAEFKWSDVSQDKDRENYLGHSINAPTGRWQKNKDIHWYQRDGPQGDEERREELRKIKEAEAEALAAALGFAPGAKSGSGSSGGAGTGANAIAVPVKTDHSLDPEKEERRLRKAQKKEEKRLKKEEKRARHHRGRGDDPGGDEDYRRRRRESRSRSPRRRNVHSCSRPPRSERFDQDRVTHQASRSRTPPRRRPTDHRNYDEEARNGEREMDRRRWDSSSRRDRPGTQWGRD